MISKLIPIALAALATLAPAQSVSQYGSACGGSGGPPPRIYFNGVAPALGGTFTFTYNGPNGGVAGVFDDHPHLLLGAHQTNLPLPTSISFFTNCTLWVTPLLVIPMPPAAGGYATQFPVVIPNDPTLMGATFYGQYMVLYQRFISPATVGLRFSGGLAVGL